MKKSHLTATKWILCFIVVFISAKNIHAQSDASCVAKAPNEIGVGQKFKYTISTTEQGDIVASDFGKFELVSGPSIGTSTSITMVNGQVDQQTTYTYTYYLTGEKEGSFTIPGITLSINGRLVKSNLVVVNVVKIPKNPTVQEPDHSDSWFHFDFPQWPEWSGRPQQEQTPPRGKTDKAESDDKIGKDDIFVKASSSQLEAFQGEAVVVTHKLYVKGDIGRYSVERAVFGQSDAFWANALELSSTEEGTETVNGKNYKVYTIKQTAFYPRKTGKLTIPKLNITLRLRIPTTVRDPFWGTYSTYKNKDVTLTANDISIKVKALPNARSSQTEIVGNFTISSNINKTEAHVNEPITLTVTISGTGNLHHIKADDLNIDFPGDCDVTYPKVTGNISAKGNIVTGSKSFKFTIIPHAEGSFHIPGATYNYYNYDTGSYKTLSSQDYQIEVLPGKAPTSPTIPENNEKKKRPEKTFKI